MNSVRDCERQLDKRRSRRIVRINKGSEFDDTNIYQTIVRVYDKNASSIFKDTNIDNHMYSMKTIELSFVLLMLFFPILCIPRVVIPFTQVFTIKR